MSLRPQAAPMFALALALFAASPAAAQPRVLRDDGQRLPAKSTDTLFAARVTKAAGLPLLSASQLRQPNPTARARELTGEGEQVLLEGGVRVERLRFKTPEEASEAAGLLGELAEVDPKEPKYVTHVFGPSTTKALLAKVRSLGKGTQLSPKLGETLGLQEKARRLKSRTLTIPAPPPGFVGVEVRLERLWVYALRFESGAQARSFAAAHVRGVKSRHVLDQVGEELLLLAGPALEDVALALKVLKAARKGRAGAKEGGKPATKAERGLIGVWTKETAASFCFVPCELFEEGARVLRQARAGKLPRGAQIDDPATKNAMIYGVESSRGDKEARARLVLTKEGLLRYAGTSGNQLTAELRYVEALLKDVGVTVEPASTTLPLPEAGK